MVLLSRSITGRAADETNARGPLWQTIGPPLRIGMVFRVDGRPVASRAGNARVR
jgi:hypothetical protein